MRVDLVLVRDGVELGDLAEYGVKLGQVSLSVATDRSSLRADVLALGGLEWGDQVQAYVGSEPYGRFSYWAPSVVWSGSLRSQMELGGPERVLELAQVWLPGPLTGTTGDAVTAGQPLLATVQDIAQSLGLGYIGPPLDLVAVSDYGWDIGTSFASVVSDITAACGTAWAPGRRGEVYVFGRPKEPTVTISADDVHSLELRPALDRLANVVVVERRSGHEPAAGATAIWDDPASLTSTTRWLPRVQVIREVPTETASLEQVAQEALESAKILGAEAKIETRASADIWPGDLVRIDGLPAADPVDVMVSGVSLTEGQATITIDGRVTELPQWRG